MKMPDEIKKGLYECAVIKRCSAECPYYIPGVDNCADRMMKDALAYIQQLEADKFVHCKDCANKGNPDLCPLCFREWRNTDGNDWVICDRTTLDGFCNHGTRDGGTGE